MAKGVLPLDNWRWQDQPLESPPEDVDPNNSLELTSWVLDQLRSSRYNDSRDLIEAGKTIKRLVELKQLRESGEKVLPKIELERQQKMSAFAAFLTLDQVNTSPCKQCTSKKSRGPCKNCVAAGPEYFNGACFNCQFSSTAAGCSFYAGKASKVKKRGHQASSKNDEDKRRFEVTSDLLSEMTTRELERWSYLIRDELECREPAHSPNKRRRI